MELIWAVVSYAVTFLWIEVVWFDFRLRIIKKQQAKINGLINKLEVLDRQLTTNE
jgi:uncharacterized membrane protein